MKFQSLKLIFLLFLLGGVAQADDYFRILEDSGRSLHVENGPLSVGRSEPGWHSAMWEMNPVGKGLFLITNRYTGQYLMAGKQNEVVVTQSAPSPTGSGPHFWRKAVVPGRDASRTYLENSSGGYLSFQGTGPTLTSSRTTVWVLEPVAPPLPEEQPVEFVRLQDAGNPSHYLHTERGVLETGSIQPGWLSARWEVRESRDRGLQLAFRNLYTGQWIVAQGESVTLGEPSQDARGGSNYLWRAVGDSQDPSRRTLSNQNRPLCKGNQGFYLGQPNDTRSVFKVKLESPSKPAAAPPPKQYYRLGNVAAPQTRLNNEGGNLQCSAVQPGWFSAMWEIEESSAGQGRVLAFRNRWTGEYLVAKANHVGLGTGQTGRDGRGPHLWRAVGSDSNPQQVTLQNLSSGTYLRYFSKSGQIGVSDRPLGGETLWWVETP